MVGSEGLVLGANRATNERVAGDEEFLEVPGDIALGLGGGSERVCEVLVGGSWSGPSNFFSPPCSWFGWSLAWPRPSPAVQVPHLPLATAPQPKGDITWNFEISSSPATARVARFAPKTKPYDPAVVAAVEAQLAKPKP